MLKHCLLLVFVLNLFGVVLSDSITKLERIDFIADVIEFDEESDADSLYLGQILIMDEEEESQDHLECFKNILFRDFQNQNPQDSIKHNIYCYNVDTYRLYVPLLYNLPPPYVV